MCAFLRLTKNLDEVKAICLHANVTDCVTKLEEILFDVSVKHGLTEAYVKRFMSASFVLHHSPGFVFLSFSLSLYTSSLVLFNSVAIGHLCLRKLVLTIYHVDVVRTAAGEKKYTERFPKWQVADFNQNADTRPRYGIELLPTLTTGCSRMFLRSQSRFLHGVELLLSQGIPVTNQIAHVMKCGLVKALSVSHRGQCFLAGNAMHSSSIGFMVCCAVMFVKV